MEKDLKEYITPPVLLVLFLLGISLMIVSPVLNMVILGAILAYAIRPLARKITSKIKIRSVSIFLSRLSRRSILGVISNFISLTIKIPCP